MGNQIDGFKNKYRVIIAESREHGKSELKSDAQNCKQSTADWEGLVSHLKLDSVSIIEWSDDGIIGIKVWIFKGQLFEKDVDQEKKERVKNKNATASQN